MKGFRVRSYRAGDLNACLSVFDSNVPQFFRQHERQEYAGFLGALPGPYVVVETEQGEIVAAGGYAIVEEEERADLCWGMVRADLHGQGLGRRLTEARIQAAVADPTVRSVAINTSQHTRGFYERLGFRLLELVPHGYAPGLHRCEMRLDQDGTGAGVAFPFSGILRDPRSGQLTHRRSFSGREGGESSLGESSSGGGL